MNPEIVVLGNQYSTLNPRQAEEARCYLSYIGNFCGANADDNKGCGKTVTELETLYKADLIKQGKKICQCDAIYPKRTPTKCDTCKGTIRVHPFLIINEKNEFGLHRIVSFPDGTEVYE